MRRGLLPAAVLAFAAALPATAYEVVTADGRRLQASSIASLGEVVRIETEKGPVELPAAGVDYYATFRANLKDSEVLIFRQGSYLRFEALEFERGRVRIQLGEERSVTVPEAIVDFRSSVLEGSGIQLPAGRGSKASVAKATEGVAPRDRGRERERPGRRPRNQRQPKRGTQTQGSR